MKKYLNRAAEICLILIACAYVKLQELHASIVMGNQLRTMDKHVNENSADLVITFHSNIFAHQGAVNPVWCLGVDSDNFRTHLYRKMILRGYSVTAKKKGGHYYLICELQTGETRV